MELQKIRNLLPTSSYGMFWCQRMPFVPAVVEGRNFSFFIVSLVVLHGGHFIVFKFGVRAFINTVT